MAYSLDGGISHDAKRETAIELTKEVSTFATTRFNVIFSVSPFGDDQRFGTRKPKHRIFNKFLFIALIFAQFPYE